MCFQPLQTLFGHFQTFFDIFGHVVDIPFFWAVQRFCPLPLEILGKDMNMPRKARSIAKGKQQRK